MIFDEGHFMTVKLRKSGTKSGTKNISKDSLAYWLARVERRKYKYKGKLRERSEYSVRIALHGKRRLIPLRTSNKSKAAEMAKKTYEKVRANGWRGVDEALPSPLPRLGNRDEITCGEYIERVRQISLVSEATLTQYLASLRRVVAFSNNIEVTKERHDYVTGGQKRWNDKVDACPLFSSLSSKNIKLFRDDFLKSAKDDSVILESRRRSFNKVLRNAKGLFSRRIISEIGEWDINEGGIKYPSRIGLLVATHEPEGNKRFKVEKEFSLTMEELYNLAQKELDSEQLVAFILASAVGLRRGEIDRLQWSSINFIEGVLSVETTKSGAPKTVYSESPLRIDSEVIAHLKTYKEKSPSREFVLPRDNEKEVSKSWTSYRANIILLSLIDWLRKVGVKANKPLHALRKLAGSEVAKSKGIFAASSFLRHKSTAVTQQHYVAPAPESPNFGKFLK